MQLGAIQPINVAQVQRPGNAPQAPVKYVPADTTGNEPATIPGSPFSPFSSDNLKKYAPYIIGAVILFYFLNRKN